MFITSIIRMETCMLNEASTSPAPPTQTWEPIDDRRPRKPGPQEMDIFE